ncbi:MAG: hypothetical protein PSV46_23220 [Reyranella sp.]|nr:hypothetical protein [Reyranella sp.]
MNTELPDDPAGHVPIGGSSAAQALGKKEADVMPADEKALIPAPATAAWRRKLRREANCSPADDLVVFT